MAEHSKPTHKRQVSLDEPPVRNLSLVSPPHSARTTSGFSDALREEDGGWETMPEQSVAVDEQPAEGQQGEDGFSSLPGETARPSSEAGEMDNAFEAVSLGGGNPPTTTFEQSSRSSHSPSPAPTSTPPLSPATTAATTVGGPSSSSLSVPPLAPTAVPEASTSSPAPSSEPATAPTPSPKPEEKTPKKPVSTKTPSAMQKFMSMTRQRDLPPKDKEEEESHLRQLAEMRAASKEAEKRRRSETEARTAARSAALASAFPHWESMILPNWRSVLHDDATGRHLRKLWWDGTMPVRWRGRLWALAIGNGLAVPKSAYARALERVKERLEEGWLREVERDAEEDAEGTLPALKLFQKGGVMHEELVDLLLAWSVYEKTEPRYPKGLAYSAALLLVNMTAAEAFVSLVNLVQKSCLRGFYNGNLEEENAYYRVFDTLLADASPRVFANFTAQVVRPSLYLRPWLTTLFVHFLPLELSTRIFDVFLLEGDSFLFRVALIILRILEPRLFNPDLEELAAVFEGKDRGAVAVVRREKGLLAPDGHAIEEKDGGIRVEVEDVYVEMGVTEERLFAQIQAMDWKEELWARLIERESPEAI